MNKLKMTRTGAMALILVVLMISTSIFVSAQVATQTTVLKSASVSGELAEQYGQNWLGVAPDQPSANLKFTMTFYPSDNSAVLNNFGFWVLDDSNVNAVVKSAGRFANNNVAAGERTNRDPLGQLSAQVTASGLANYTIVVYNDSTIPVEYTLSVENGMIVDDAGQVKDASGMGVMSDMATTETTKTTTAVTTTTTTATATTDVDMDAAKAAATTYTVVSGDTLGKIANATYGNVTYYKGICSFNELTNCNILEVGQELLLPDVAVLDAMAGGATTTTVTRATVTATAATTDTVTDTVTATETTTTTVETAPVAEAAAPATTLETGDGVTYTVVSGDTLATIALAAYGDLNLYQLLCDFNNIADCNVIEVGQEILLPALDVLAPPGA